MTTYLRAILSEANKRGMLKVSLDKAFEVVRKITRDRNASVGYGRFILFLQMMDPTHKFVWITRNPSKGWSKYKASLKERSKEPVDNDEYSNHFKVDQIKTLPARLDDWIKSPECWQCLHLCGNGFYTFCCHNWQHVYAGTSLLNVRGKVVHHYLAIMRQAEDGANACLTKV
jgi:hypothetical protein